MIRLGFLDRVYILINFLRHNFNFELEISFVFSRKINSKYPKGRENICLCWEVLASFILLKQFKYKFNFKNFNKNKDACKDVFNVFVWLSHPNALGQK